MKISDIKVDVLEDNEALELLKGLAELAKEGNTKKIEIGKVNEELISRNLYINLQMDNLSEKARERMRELEKQLIETVKEEFRGEFERVMELKKQMWNDVYNYLGIEEGEREKPYKFNRKTGMISRIDKV